MSGVSRGEMDTALKQINKKTWNYTKTIMIWNVLAFLDSIALFFSYMFDLHLSLFIWLFVFLVISIMMAVHSAWQLEEKL